MVKWLTRLFERHVPAAAPPRDNVEWYQRNPVSREVATLLEQHPYLAPDGCSAEMRKYLDSGFAADIAESKYEGAGLFTTDRDSHKYRWLRNPYREKEFDHICDMAGMYFTGHAVYLDGPAAKRREEAWNRIKDVKALGGEIP
jgi:hypothetical protein